MNTITVKHIPHFKPHDVKHILNAKKWLLLQAMTQSAAFSMQNYLKEAYKEILISQSCRDVTCGSEGTKKSTVKHWTMPTHFGEG